jgi:hypothetical protein
MLHYRHILSIDIHVYTTAALILACALARATGEQLGIVGLATWNKICTPGLAPYLLLTCVASIICYHSTSALVQVLCFFALCITFIIILCSSSMTIAGGSCILPSAKVTVTSCATNST